MCIGVPAKVVSIDEASQTAIVDSAGREHQASLMMLDQSVKPGDYLLIQVGGFAVEVIEPEQAEQALALQQALAEGDYERASQLY